MTIFKPHHHHSNIILNCLLVIFGTVFAGSVTLLIVLYNRGVNLEHRLSELTLDIERSETATAELKDSFFTLLSTENLEHFAEAHGLVKEKNPEYLELQETWELASQY